MMRKQRQVVVAIVGIWAGAMLGCGGPNKYMVRGERIAAGADANITVGHEGGNAQVEVEAANLPPANRVEPDASVFVVWFQGEDGRTSKAGELQYDEDDRTGTMRATTPHRQFEVIITAERASDAESPSEHVVFRQPVEAS